MNSPAISEGRKGGGRAIYTQRNGRRDGDLNRKDSGYVSYLHSSHRAEEKGSQREGRDNSNEGNDKSKSVAGMDCSSQTWVCKKNNFTFYNSGQFWSWGLILAWRRHLAAVELLSCCTFARSGRYIFPAVGWRVDFIHRWLLLTLCTDWRDWGPSLFWACPTRISHSSVFWLTHWVLLREGDFPATMFCFLTMPVISVLNSMVSFSSLFSSSVWELSSESQA